MNNSDKQKSQEYKNFETLAGKVFQVKPKDKDNKSKNSQKQSNEQTS